MKKTLAGCRFANNSEVMDGVIIFFETKAFSLNEIKVLWHHCKYHFAKSKLY